VNHGNDLLTGFQSWVKVGGLLTSGEVNRIYIHLDRIHQTNIWYQIL